MGQGDGRRSSWRRRLVTLRDSDGCSDSRSCIADVCRERCQFMRASSGLGSRKLTVFGWGGHDSDGTNNRNSDKNRLETEHFAGGRAVQKLLGD